jgi:hypothetical protein
MRLKKRQEFNQYLRHPVVTCCDDEVRTQKPSLNPLQFERRVELATSVDSEIPLKIQMLIVRVQ